MYLCELKASNPGVVGRLASWTVSRVDAAPLAPLDEPLDTICVWSSESLSRPSSLAAIGGVAVGVDRCTTMLGVVEVVGFVVLVGMRELCRDGPVVVGEGDLTLGDRGHCGVFSPDVVPCDLCGCCGFALESVRASGCSCGVLDAESARCIAAAEGTDVPVAGALGRRCGLTS